MNDIMFITEDSKHVTIFGSKMGIFSVYLDKINLADVNLMKMMLKLLFM